MELTTHKLRISQSTVNTILSRAQGHYKSILLSAGADEMIFKTKNLECPWCAGVDRFSYTDKFGKGDSFCPSLRLPQRSRSSDENQEFRLR